MLISAHLNKDPNHAKVRELTVIDKDILNKGQPQSRLRSPGIRTLPISSCTVPEVDAGDGDVVAVGEVVVVFVETCNVRVLRQFLGVYAMFRY